MTEQNNQSLNRVNPDLVKERQGASFRAEDFAIWWHGGVKELQNKRDFENFMFEDFLEYGHMMEYLCYEDIYQKSVELEIECFKKLKKYQELKNPGGTEIFTEKVSSSSCWALVPLGNPNDVQFTVVLMALRSQATPEQYEKFGKRTERFEICSAFCQTELGHGTFLRGLETRADYDRATQEFVLNTPTISAYKFWPGGLGHTTNYALVVAQLYIDNKAKGVQMFWVPIRDEATHLPLPGIDVGDIGRKLGLPGINNGFLGLKNVRIPRDHMLMRHDQVLADGTFVKGPSAVLTYFTLVWGRVYVIQNVSGLLASAVTIATRYSAVRHQCPIEPNLPEVQIMDHVTQQYKVLPELAKAVAFGITGRYLGHLFHEVKAHIADGDISRLPEFHALSCALKATMTYDGSRGVELARLACGGHGYLSSSHLPTLYTTITASCTFEGENTVLQLQAGRFLLKKWQQALDKQPLQPTIRFLSEVVAKPEFGTWTLSRGNIVKAFQYTTARKIRKAFENFLKRLEDGQSEAEAANKTGIEVIQAADFYARSFICSTFLQHIQNPPATLTCPKLLKVLNNLLELYLVKTMLDHLADIIQVVPLSEDDVARLQSRLEELLEALRPDAVTIVDGFDLHDLVLNSTLGSFDGNAMERIFAEARRSPLNRLVVPKVFHTHLKPYMNSKL